jgi:hypothetical protein
VQAILQNLQNQQNATDNLLGLNQGLGARFGTDLYEDYLLSASRSLSDVVATAVQLFRQMVQISFPTEMCPTDNKLPPALDILAPPSS